MGPSWGMRPQKECFRAFKGSEATVNFIDDWLFLRVQDNLVANVLTTHNNNIGLLTCRFPAPSKIGVCDPIAWAGHLCLKDLDGIERYQGLGGKPEAVGVLNFPVPAALLQPFIQLEGQLD